MSGLQPLRTRLTWLCWRRAGSRWQAAIGRVVVYIALVLFGLFVIDLNFRLSILPRGVLMAVAGIWLLRRVIHEATELLGHRESLIDVALLLERHHRLDGDLVAALQFESQTSSGWGSLDLRAAVVRHAASLTAGLQYAAANPKRDTRRESWRALTAILLIVVGFALFPIHARVFCDRLLLQPAVYPSRTQIVSIKVNGQLLDHRAACQIVEGEPVAFEVHGAGRLPAAGELLLTGHTSGDSTSILLKRLSRRVDPGQYAATGPELDETVSFSVRLGDAKSVNGEIEVIRRPIVELTIEVTPPDYARESIGSTTQQEHVAQAFEGSAVGFQLRATNGKELANAALVLIDDDTSVKLPFAKPDTATDNWRVESSAAVLKRVTRDLRFRVDVVDEDGLTPRNAIQGAIRVQSDQLPDVRISTLHQAILPAARPSIEYQIDDDFGIRQLLLQLKQTPLVGSMAVTFEQRLDPKTWREDSDIAVVGEHRLDFSRFKLAKGDRIMVTMEAIDYRGEWPGLSQISDPLEFRITDEHGALEAILQSDAQAERLITEAIEQELGIPKQR